MIMKNKNINRNVVKYKITLEKIAKSLKKNKESKVNIGGLEFLIDKKPETENEPAALSGSLAKLIDRAKIADRETLDVLRQVDEKAARLQGSFGKLDEIEMKMAQMRVQGELGIQEKTEKLRGKVDLVVNKISKMRSKEDSK